MLTKYGLPFLVWLDDEVVPSAYDVLDTFNGYVKAWRSLLDV